MLLFLSTLASQTKATRGLQSKYAVCTITMLPAPSGLQAGVVPAAGSVPWAQAGTTKLQML